MILVVEINVGYLTKKSDHKNIDKTAKHVASSQLCYQIDNVFYYLKIIFFGRWKK